MNIGRIVAGGLLAGVVMNIIDFIVNGLFLGERWSTAMQTRGIDPAAVPLGGAGWIIADFIAGWFVVWLYAAIHPRFGRGPLTSLIAAVAMWLIAHVTFSSLWFMGVFPWKLIALSGLGALVSALVAALVGCAVYKE